jgi:diguanylate cyclase (GGDEF)-like protein
MRDDLTGLLNRRGIRNALAATMRPGANRDPEPCALLTLDLDDFKSINDRYGHPAGDTLLFLIGQRIARCLRSCDHVGRTGGDEFVVILCRLRRFEAVSIVVRKIARVFAAPFDLGRRSVSVTASIGVATFPADAETAPVLVRRSDRALFEAKRRGKRQHLTWRDLVLEGGVPPPRSTRDDTDYYISINAAGN